MACGGINSNKANFRRIILKHERYMLVRIINNMRVEVQRENTQKVMQPIMSEVCGKELKTKGVKEVRKEMFKVHTRLDKEEKVRLVFFDNVS